MEKRSAEVRALLGPAGAQVPDEVVHRDDLVVLDGAGAGVSGGGKGGA
jgi:hypothetical protein